MGFEETGIRLERGVIQVDERFHTGVGNVWAIGDAIGGRMLAHKAEDEGVAAVENAAGKHGHVNYDAVANVVYTWPEIASVGMTEEEAKAAGREVQDRQVPLDGQRPRQGHGRARRLREGDRRRQDRPRAGRAHPRPARQRHDRRAALAIEFQASAEDIARTVHAHPTLPEAVKEAALAVGGRAIHI
jgi:dihydrolipoamide dehydrogenase